MVGVSSCPQIIPSLWIFPKKVYSFLTIDLPIFGSILLLIFSHLILPLQFSIWIQATTCGLDTYSHHYPPPPHIPITLIPTPPVTIFQKFIFPAPNYTILPDLPRVPLPSLLPGIYPSMSFFLDSLLKGITLIILIISNNCELIALTKFPLPLLLIRLLYRPICLLCYPINPLQYLLVHIF